MILNLYKEIKMLISKPNALSCLKPQCLVLGVTGLQKVTHYIILLLFTVMSNVTRYFCMTSNLTYVRLLANVKKCNSLLERYIITLPLLSKELTN